MTLLWVQNTHASSSRLACPHDAIEAQYILGSTVITLVFANPFACDGLPVLSIQIDGFNASAVRTKEADFA